MESGGEGRQFPWTMLILLSSSTVFTEVYPTPAGFASLELLWHLEGVIRSVRAYVRVRARACLLFLKERKSERDKCLSVW